MIGAAFQALIFLLITTSTNAQQTVDIVKHCPSLCMCDNVERFVMCDEKQLSTVPGPLPEGTKMLGLSKNAFQTLTTATFKGIGIGSTLSSLVLYGNYISDIQPGTFAGLENLQYIWLFKNRLTRIQANTFEQLRHLTELDLSRNQLTLIENGAFNGLEELKILQLWGNHLTTLSPDAFVGMPVLGNLTLGDNLMTEIPTSSFKPLRNLTSIELLNLRITHIRANAFSTLINLEKLHIGDWPYLQSIDNQAFAGLENLQYISLYNCQLKEVPQIALQHLPNLQHLMLSNNEDLHHLKKDDFIHNTNLQALFLSNTSISTMHESPFRLLTNLQHLDLSRNKITIIPTHVFFQLENLQALNLSHNNIKELSSGVFYTLKKLTDVDLLDNPLVCDCGIKWLKALQVVKIREHFNLQGKCADPYSGTDIVQLSAQKFVCEVPQFVKDEQETIVALLGTTAFLPCKPDHGVPTPTIEWHYLDATTPEKATHYQLLANGTLRIPSVKSKDYGKYMCVASNRLGQANQTVTLAQFAPPDQATGGSSAVAGVLITLAIIVLLVLLVLYVYKRRSYKSLRSGLYDVMSGDTENERTSISKPKEK